MFTDPLKNLKALGLREDNIVADLGAGTGYYSLISGTLVPRGKVYAVEVQKDFLETIKNKVKEAHLNNIEIIWGNVEKIGGTKLKDSVVDVAIVSNILFQVEDRDNFILEIKRILKQNGKVLLIDWLPSPMMKENNTVPKQKACEMFEKNGFAVEREINAGDYNYGIILRKI